MTVRCKMTCMETGTQAHGGNKIHNARFVPVMDDTSENKDFFASTPGGELSLEVVSEQHFEAGKDYYIDIQIAE